MHFYMYEKEKQYKISKENHKQTSALGEVLSSLVLLRLCMSESGFSLKCLYCFSVVYNIVHIDLETEFKKESLVEFIQERTKNDECKFRTNQAGNHYGQ